MIAYVAIIWALPGCLGVRYSPVPHFGNISSQLRCESGEEARSQVDCGRRCLEDSDCVGFGITADDHSCVLCNCNQFTSAVGPRVSLQEFYSLELNIHMGKYLCPLIPLSNYVYCKTFVRISDHAISYIVYLYWNEMNCVRVRVHNCPWIRLIPTNSDSVQTISYPHYYIPVNVCICANTFKLNPTCLYSGRCSQNGQYISHRVFIKQLVI